MRKRLTKIGNSHGVILEKAVLDFLKIDSDTELEIFADNGKIVLSPISAEDQAQRFEDAMKKVNRRYAKTFKRLAAE